MNEELKSILMNLPEGIVLINDDSNEVALYNQEFNRIFTVEQYTSPDGLRELIQQPIVKIYSESGNPNEFRTDFNISLGVGEDMFDKLSILQASFSPEGVSFRVLPKI